MNTIERNNTGKWAFVDEVVVVSARFLPKEELPTEYNTIYQIKAELAKEHPSLNTKYIWITCNEKAGEENITAYINGEGGTSDLSNIMPNIEVYARFAKYHHDKTGDFKIDHGNMKIASVKVSV